MGQRQLPAFDCFHVRGFHLRLVMHEQELREVIVDAGALQVFARGERVCLGERLAPELLVHGGARDQALHQSFRTRCER